MSCGKAILETPSDVVSQIHRHVLKKLARLSPSFVENHVVEIGKFSDTWAPKKLRGRRLYAAVFHALSKPVSPDDPFTASGSLKLTIHIVYAICGPQSGASNPITWSGCIDSAYEGGSCLPSAVAANINFNQCEYIGDYYAPYMYTLSAAPSSYTDFNVVTAFAKPCPVASSAPAISGKPRMSDTVKLRCVQGNDTTNKAFYNRYVAVDSSTNTYSFAGLSIGGAYKDGGTVYHDMYSVPGSSVSKGSTDVYYYFFTAGFYYAV
jgi:hypothetical protein